MTAAKGDLVVRFAERDVGSLRAGPNNTFTFTYGPSWLALETSFPVSLSLPLRAEAYVDGAAHTFFANLLPEGGVRQAVCRRLGISEDNDLALLRAIGGECAGALAIVDPDVGDRSSSDHDYEELDASRLRALVSDDQLVPLLVGGPATRLSLAGAQDKLPVALLDGKVWIPRGSAASTHILKLPHRRYAHIPVNEAYVTGVATRLGFDAVTATLFDRTDPPSLLVERYDRRVADNPRSVTRLHQEDLCQALGSSPSRKYEQEGGPTLAAAINLVRAHVRNPIGDVERLVGWQAFNVVTGNSDGHGKNLSILYDEHGTRLAPFYDLLSTRHYEGLDRLLAMSVGGTRDPDLLDRARWTTLARELTVGASTIMDIVLAVTERSLEAVGPWTREFRERYGDQSILQTLPRAIAKRARKLRKAVS